VLRYLQKVDGVPKLHGNGTYQSNNSSYLVMRKEHTYPRNLETLSARGVFQVIHGLTSIANKMHALGLLHNNLHTYNLMYEQISGNLVLAGFQYASADPEGAESARQRCRDFGINDHSPLKVKPTNVKSMDTAARSTKHDSFNLGAIILALLGRDLQKFSKRRQTDLSPLENLSRQQIAILVIKGTDTFNSFLDPRSEKLEQGEISVLIQLVCGLLHADPALRIHCAAALAILNARPNRLQPQLPKELIVPAKLVESIREMQGPTKIKACFDCVDPTGNVIEGMSLWSFGGACAGDLLAPYMGLVQSKQEGDVMFGNGHGTNLKSIKLNGMDMVIDSRWNNNGCADLFFFPANGPAGLANCNASVQVKRDGKGVKRIKVTRFPTNAYFETVMLSRPFMLPVPGRHWSNEVILLQAFCDKDDEQIFVDYGNGTMMNMFGVCSGEIVVPRPM
jgi:serine/threonine protein kinase